MASTLSRSLRLVVMVVAIAACGSHGDDAGLGGGDGGGGEGSDGACGHCNTPPDDCHAREGTCHDGTCSYDFVAYAQCDDGDACTVGDVCVNGGCYGTPMTCDDPPAAACLSSTQSRTYDAQGTCDGGLCVYSSHTTTCAGAPCENGLCSDDPCAGISCHTPPAPAVCYAAAGVCGAGSCTYAYADGATCNDNNACTTGDECNTGVCRGIPVSCNAPPANTCVNSTTLKAYVPTGTCSAGSCSYTYNLISCSSGCANAMCTPTGWATMTSNTTRNLLGVWGSSATNVWAVGNYGTTVLYNGVQWQVRSVPAEANGAYMVAVHGTAANNVFALAGRVLIRFDGSQWNVVATLSSLTCPKTTGLFATGDANNTVYVSCNDAAGDRYVLFTVSGTGTVTQVTSYTDNSDSYYAGGVWYFSATDVWVAGHPPHRWNGSTLTAPGSAQTTELWGASPESMFGIYFAGGWGSYNVERWTGSAWSELNTGLGGNLSGITGTSASRVFVSGTNDSTYAGAVLYYDGVGFTQQTLPSGVGPLNAIWAAPTGEVFAVGDDGTILKGP